MILQIDPVQTFREVSLALYVVLLVIECSIGVYFLNAYRKNKDLYFIGSIGMFFFFLFAGRIVLIIFDYYLAGLNPTLYPEFFTYYKIGIGLQAIGLGFFLYVAERVSFRGKDKYVISVGYVICVSLAAILPDFILSQTFTTVAALFVVFIPLSFIYITMKGTGPFRTQSLFLASGVIAITIGSLLTSEFLMGLLSPTFDPYAVHIISIILKLVGGILINREFSLQLRREGE